jgi:hypothetical protein
MFLNALFLNKNMGAFRTAAAVFAHGVFFGYGIFRV